MTESEMKPAAFTSLSSTELAAWAQLGETSTDFHESGWHLM